jgi:hypothetical protein
MKGFRHILVKVLFPCNLSIRKNSKLDLFLLRAANQALLNQKNGHTDSFLFILCDCYNNEEFDKKIISYGFPTTTEFLIITGKGSILDTLPELNLDLYFDRIDACLSSWLQEKHPAALADLTADGYWEPDWWWTGVESVDNQMEPYLERFREILPTVHKNKAETWLAIAMEAFGLEDPYGWLPENNFALFCAALCEWLHGFEAASGNGFNNFDAELVKTQLEIDDFFLGYLLCQNETEDIEIVADEYGDDLTQMCSHSLKLAVAKKRSEIRNGLSSFFGSETALLWALHSALWPKFNTPIVDASNDLVNPTYYDEFAEVDAVWRFVTEGWIDEADNE